MLRIGRHHFKVLTVGGLLLPCALALSLGVAGASGQTISGKKKPRRASGSSSVANKSRARRVVTAPSDAPAPGTEQPAGPAAVESAGQSSDKPPIAAGQVAEEATETSDISDSEMRDDAGVNAPKTSPSLRDQIESLPSGPERIRLQLKLAEQLVAADKKAEATAELHAITNTDVFDPQGFYNTGNALARLDDLDEAISAYRKAINQRKGNYSRALNNLGVILLREGLWDEAQEALTTALKLESFHYAEASYNLGRLYSARGENDRAIREWQRALAVDPKHAGAARALAGNEPESEGRPKTLARTPSVARNSVRERTRSGESNLSAVRPEAGRSPVKNKRATIMVVDPVTHSFLQRARALSEQGKLLEAAENYKKVIARSGGYFAPANLELGCVLLNLKRFDEALASLQPVTYRDSTLYPVSNYYVARLYERRGNLVLAEESFARAGAAYKAEDPAILLDISRVRDKRGDFNGALEALEEYLRLMADRGIKPSWAEHSLSQLRQKAGK
jgi:tetratricopeptide (TPR) repeat protein